MKITIIGTSGGGKSTLARKISKAFNIPRLELDRLWFAHDGHVVMHGAPQEKQRVQEKIKHDVENFLHENTAWVCDGTYSKIQPLIAEQADIVVLIQRPLLFRLCSHVLRVFHGKDRHSEVTRIQDLMFTKTLVKRWLKNEDGDLTSFAKQFEAKTVTLHSFAEIDKFATTLFS